MKITDSVFSFPETGAMDCNTYVIKDEITVLIDPGLGHYFPVLVRAMEEEGIDPSGIGKIVNTHLHLDHYWASAQFKKASGASILLHPLQKEFYELTVVGVSQMFGMEPIHIEEDELMGERLKTGKLDFEIISAPGHSPDSICFYCREQDVMICGDVVFGGNTGRVDFPGGSGDLLKDSIERLSKLNIEHLLPGHMGIVSGADKVQRNFEFVSTAVFPYL